LRALTVAGPAAQNFVYMAAPQVLKPGEGFDVEQLLTPAEARATYFAAVAIASPGIEHVSLADAAGRHHAAPPIAATEYPADPRSMMDGFALVADRGRSARRIVGEVLMGHAPPGGIGPDEAMRIPTGGVVPPGADSVVPVEDTVESQTASGAVVVPNEELERGENVTPAGSDMRPGDCILAAGRRIGGPELGVLATLGIVRVPVYRRPRVAIISTGDELVDAAAQPGRGQVRDSNRWAIAGSLISLGCVPVQRPVALDTPEALTAALRSALDDADAVVLTGGSSVGVRDLTPRVIDGLGKPGVIVHGIRVKPGKPTVFAMLEGKPVIGLPGNPTSSLMILEAVVAPVFSRLAGEAQTPDAEVAAVAERPFEGRAGWTWFVPAEIRREHGQVLASALLLRSANTSLLARAHGYVVVGPEHSTIAAGQPVIVHRFSSGGRAG
jgi:molybdenum cofactor synthesis domain-containing protein